MSKKSLLRGALALTATATLLPALPALAQDGPRLQIGGTTYTKWLWGNLRDQGALYNFTTIPGEGYGDNGQGTELELLLNARLSSQVEIRGRIHSRFSQNFWTNFGGFGGDPNKPCVNGDCGEFDPRSNQYIKLRGMAVTLTPGYLVDSATIGANDFGQFDPFVIGRIRYIDRDNAHGILLQGSGFDRKITWDATRISLPRLWAGPSFSTGLFHASDAAYGFQTKWSLSEALDVGGIFNYVNDAEIAPPSVDNNIDDGRDLTPRFRNGVGGVKANLRVGDALDVRGALYHSYANADPVLSPANFGLNGFSPVPAGRREDQTYQVNVTLNDPLDIGLSVNLQGFSIGADYVAIMAARRESDVLLTEGHDGSFAFPDPSNSSFGVYKGNPTKIGYGGWTGETQQLATINVDNDFTDFDEPFAETAIGWKGFTVNPVYSNGALDLTGEYSFITYNTNWQAYDDDQTSYLKTPYPTAELDPGVGHNFRTAYQPFQDKRTHIAVVRGKYVVDVAKGIDVFGKVKFIHETDKRINEARFLPYQAGACSEDGLGCQDLRNEYAPGLSTADTFGNPGIVEVNGQRGYQWKPFTSLKDDDRLLRYSTFTLGAGYQLTDDLYASLSYTKYLADLFDGNTAFQAYSQHQMASGFHNKNSILVKAKYILAGVEFGLEGQYAFGTFEPDFGDGFLPTVADAQTAADHNVAVGSLGFRNRNGGWNSLETRDFQHYRMKAFMKAQF
ncbi:hypothetical protein POL68_18660 [Stigmatella sp. ncwal1]|uniref:Uncharacterized protein n=1 Tax=Stigmatella ashevillensis TaxID=2995309 RepID=A0ABT5D9Y9_9BACT|nr:hypothetical protein [Stigmatella ashevillena]MDC0710505.1 hypothetical protein [Stigmatella ashevillena]